ncbi:hypothetical protein R1sor_014883 [Riccia sorocarpa]|uniref:Uncharacterized protein n=1 Tax=Riccia sorocarpa TaxID=122646 RepID=A0ABD3HDI6_9MARC
MTHSKSTYEGELLELQSAAFAVWKVEYEEYLANQIKLKAAMKEDDEQLPEDFHSDPLIYLQKLARIRELRKLKEFKALPHEYGGQLLELQYQILRRWKNSDEYKALLSKKRKKVSPPPVFGDLLWWQWIPTSGEYKGRILKQNPPGPGEEATVAGFQSAEYKVEGKKEKSQRWDSQTKEPYKSLEYNKMLADKAKPVNQV